MAKVANEYTINSLPDDIFVKLIFKLLGLSDLVTVSLISRRFNRLTKNAVFWRDKFRDHFPHRLAEITAPDPNWYLEFIRISLDEYKDLAPAISDLFFKGKEGNTQYLAITSTYFLPKLFDHIDKYGYSPIKWLIRNKHQPLLNYIYKIVLREYNIQPRNLKVIGKYLRGDKYGWSLAHWAVVCNQFEDILSQHVENQNFDNFPMTPFHVAAEFGLDSVIDFLKDKFSIDHQTNYFVSNEMYHKTALHLAIENGHLTTVNNLLAKGAKPTIPVTYEKLEHPSLFGGAAGAINPARALFGGTALYTATLYNRTEVAEVLTEYISPLDSNFWYSPLAKACEQNNQRLFDYFVTKIKEDGLAKDPKVRDSINYALYLAMSKQLRSFLKPLIELGADVRWRPSQSEDGLRKHDSAVDIALANEDDEAILAFYRHVPLPEIRYDSPNLACGPMLIAAVFGLALGMLVMGFLLGTYPNLNPFFQGAIVIGSLTVPTALFVLGAWYVASKCIRNRENKILNRIQEVVSKDKDAACETSTYIEHGRDLDQELQPLRRDHRATTTVDNYRRVGFLKDKLVVTPSHTKLPLDELAGMGNEDRMSL